jgi:hypothetical protein
VGTDVARELHVALAALRPRIHQSLPKTPTEEETKVTLIAPLLRALGWDLENLDEVRYEYRYRPGSAPVDYAFLLFGKAALFLEAKALNANLDDPKWTNQTLNYANNAGVTWCILTNGRQYRIYNAHAPVEADKKLFQVVDLLTDDNERVTSTLALFSREYLRDRGPLPIWEAHFADRQVRAALEKMIAEPADVLVNALHRQTGGLAKAQIRKSLQRARLQLDFPPLPRQEAEQSEEESKPSETAYPEPAPRTAGRLTFAELIESGVAVPGMILHATYKKTHLRATVSRDGSIDFLGTHYPSPSAAASAARKHVSGPRPGGGAWSTNGWTFWRVADDESPNATLDEWVRKRTGS